MKSYGISHGYPMDSYGISHGTSYGISYGIQWNIISNPIEYLMESHGISYEIIRKIIYMNIL
jgi:hypothetical protein